VIESPKRPPVRVVAARAVDTEPARVRIFSRMTCTAFHRSVSIRLRHMALLARDDRVNPHQRKDADVVVESYIDAPTALAVTATARLAQLAGVHVVGLMTGTACRRKIGAHVAASMTAVTRDRDVTAAKRKYRVNVVVERGPVPT
jgi:hypothetical protein